MNIYEERRLKLTENLSGDIAVIIPGSVLANRSNDTAYPFRQDSNFYYLSGFNEPDSTLMIINKSGKTNSIGFVPKKDKLKEIWDGFRHGPEGMKLDFGFNDAFNNDEIDELLPDLLDGVSCVYYPFGKVEGFDQKVIKWTKKANSKDRHSKKMEIADISKIIGNKRLIKDSSEINIIEEACKISANAHLEAMKFVKPGMNEAEVEAFYLYEFAKNGGRFPAYNPIVASGENACVLHYVENNQVINDGDLLLVDAGCEYEMYASDITRTFPANGKFSDEQLQIYNIVLEAQKASVDAVSKGNGVMDPQTISEKVITEGLIDLGIIKGNLEEEHEKGSFKDFYMHKIGHWMGMDVHDVGDYMHEGEFIKFDEGMITTIEPGIYISSTSDVDDKWKGIGIRIEDDVLVTKDGNKNLTDTVPTDPAEIESLMQES